MQLPTVIQSSDAQASCVVLPLALYERLSGSVSLPPSSPTEHALVLEESFLPSAQAHKVPPAPAPPTLSVSLQDLLHAGSSTSVETTSFVATPQIETLEDRFAFDGDEVRILPQIKQKQGLGNPASGPIGPTLA